MANRFYRSTKRRLGLTAVVVLLLVALTGSSAYALPKVRTLGKSGGDGKFHVVGTKIIGPNGGVFVPRGVNLGGLEQSPVGYDLGYWNFKRMKDWGINFVRVALSDAFWLKSMCTYDKAYATRVDQIVKWGEQLKMLIVLDDHHGTQGKTCGTGKWHNLERAPDIHNLAFVKQLASRYKDNPYVAIDLYNEPYLIFDDVWRNGGPVFGGYRGVGMQQLLDAVRSTGAKNLVFVTGNLWGNDLRMVVNQRLINDRDVVYAAHAYPFQCDGVEWGNKPFICRGKRYPQHLDTHIKVAIGKLPVMLTEFGTFRPYAGEMSEPIEWAEANKVGWAAWLWCRGPVGNFCLLSEGAGNKPSVTGQPVRDALRRATGK
jgi:endoglucanase